MVNKCNFCHKQWENMWKFLVFFAICSPKIQYIQDKYGKILTFCHILAKIQYYGKGEESADNICIPNIDNLMLGKLTAAGIYIICDIN